MPYKDPAAQKMALQRHYQANREAAKLRSQEAWRRKKEWFRTLKDGKPCADCGVAYPARVMQFHHEGEGKTDEVSQLLRNRGRQHVLAEIAKCVLLCANCHALRHNEDLAA